MANLRTIGNTEFKITNNILDKLSQSDFHDKIKAHDKVKLSFIAPPFQGHSRILAKWAQELMNLSPNVEITFILTGWNDVQCSAAEIEKLKACGMKVIALNDDEKIQGSAPMKFTFPRVVKLTDVVMDHCKGSDYIVYDFFSLEGYIASKKLQIPAICSMPAIMGTFNNQHPIFQQGIKDNQNYIDFLSEKYQLSIKDNLEMVSDGFYLPSDFKNVVWTWPGLLKEEKDKDYLMNRKNVNNYIFMRPESPLFETKDAIFEKVKTLKRNGKKIIYFSLGTVVTKNLWDHEPDVKNFVNHIFEILLKKYSNHPKYELVISTGRLVSDLNILKDKPDNFHIYESVPQADLLKYCDLFITHAGGNSVNDAIDANTPMVAIPFFGDQHVCAEYMTKRGLGISFLHEDKNKDIVVDTQAKLFFRPSFDEKSFYAAVEMVLKNACYKLNIKKIKSQEPSTSNQFLKTLQNLKTLRWKEGDLLFGCTPDRNKLAELTQQQAYFRIGDMRPFTILFPNQDGEDILPRIVDQYHDVITRPEVFGKELKAAHSKIYTKTLQEYREFLKKNPKYLQPIGSLDAITPDKGRAYLETLWNMCLGGLEFFTTIKKQTIHFAIGMFNHKYNEAPIKEMQWIKQNWQNELVRNHVKFYIINNGLIKQVDPVAHNWFSAARPTPHIMDVAPEKLNLTPQKWNQFNKELLQKSIQINPHRFYNHFKENYLSERKILEESKLQILDVVKNPQASKQLLDDGEVCIYALLPNGQLCMSKKLCGNEKISHAVVAKNQDVLCSGEVRMRKIMMRGKITAVLDLSNDSGHYQPSTENLPKVIDLFEKINVPVYRVTGVHPGMPQSFDKVEEKLDDVNLFQTKYA